MKDFIWYFGFFHIVLYTALGICTIYKRYAIFILVDWWKEPMQKISEFRKY
jgi:hypothetical protein